MRSRNARRIVVDADVGAHALGKEDDPLGPACREFLRTMRRKTRHQAVASKQLYTEWRTRGKRSLWFKEMFQTTRFVVLKDTEDGELRDAIREAAPGPTACDEMLKDVHLLEAALVTDNTVASCNDAERRSFARVSGQPGLARIKGTVWMDPAKCDEATDWLLDGAPSREDWKLGHTADE